MDRKHQAGASTGMGLVMILIAAAFIIGPMLITNLITAAVQLILVGFGVLLLLVGGIIVIITRLYRKTAMDEAFVRTGMGGRKTVIDGGALVIPVVHEVVDVSLETMKLEVDRQGGEALITKPEDSLRVDVKAEFFIRVEKDPQAVDQAATTLGQNAGSAEGVRSVVFEKLVDGLRTVSAKKTLEELHSDREGFSKAVQEAVSTALQENGLTLEGVSISKLDQTPPSSMSPEDNVFDAVGRRRIAEITQKARVERNELERTADKEVKAQDVDRDKFVFEQDKAQANAESDRDQEVSRADARAGVADVERERAIEVADVERQQAVDVAEQAREQAQREAEVAKERAVEIADRDREVAVAEKERERAAAQAETARADAEREEAAQAVKTVEVVKTAERDKQRAIIDKQAGIEQERQEEQMKADVEAYTDAKKAEGRQRAAEADAVATRTAAEAEKDSNTLKAEGQRAVEMVPVEVDREKVVVEDDRVAVERKRLEQQAEFETIARELQVELATIEAEKDARIAMAEAFGKALSAADMTIWGDPSTVSRISEKFFQGQGLGFKANGLMAGMMPETRDAAGKVAGGIGKVGSALIKRFTGVDISPDEVESIVAEHLGNGESSTEEESSGVDLDLADETPYEPEASDDATEVDTVD